MITGCLGESRILLPHPSPAPSVSPIPCSLPSHPPSSTRQGWDKWTQKQLFIFFVCCFLGFFVVFFLNKKFIANIEIDFLHTGISELRKNYFVPFSFKTGKEKREKRKKEKKEKEIKI